MAGKIFWVLLLGLAGGLATAVRAENPDALWQLVHDRCLPAAARQPQDPAPCAAVDVGNGTALLKDRNGIAQFLLIPTARVTGIESPDLLAAAAPNYFAAAWQARSRLDALLPHPLPREAVSLAINSAFGRSQNQLHIHIDCLRGDVRALLRRQQDHIGEHWAPLPVALAGHSYLARRLTGEDLGDTDPLKLIAREIPGAAQAMGGQTLVVAGTRFADGQPGFLLLNDHADAATGDAAHGEELQDHNCEAARN